MQEVAVALAPGIFGGWGSSSIMYEDLETAWSGGLFVKDFVRIMKALSEPNRVKILKILQRRNLCVCEIQAILDIAQPTVSKHLKVLEDAGLVSYEKDGLWVNYRLAAGSTPYAAVMLGCLQHWLEDVPEVAQLLRKATTVSRKELKETSGQRL